MKVKVIILPDGNLSAFVEEGTYEEGKAKITKALQALGAAGVELKEVGKVEQHRHDAGHTHIQTENKI